MDVKAKGGNLYDITKHIRAERLNISSIVKQVGWSKRKFYRHREQIAERYKLDFELFKKIEEEKRNEFKLMTAIFSKGMEIVFGLMVKLY